MVKILTPEQRAAAAAKLAEARSAYHSLMTGTQARVVVDENGERVEFTAANSAKLALYIQQLEMQTTTTPDLSSFAPARFIF